MSKIFYPTAEKLSYLLESIHNREIALPDFQRDFVWDPRATEELIESICQNFPAGSLLRIKNAHGFFFSPREVAGAPELNGNRPSYLVLDGQQRLTSLYQAFYGAGSHRYFIHLEGLIDGGDLEDAVFFLPRSRAKRRYGTLAQQAATLTFPFKLLFGDSGGFEEWLDRVLDDRPEEGVEQKALKRNLRDMQKRWLRSVENYEFPVVTLADDTSASAVCTIFETLNRTGVKLSVFDLLGARFWSEELRLRELWEKAREEDFPIIADFDVDPYYVLQSAALFTADAAPSCKRSDVLRMDVDRLRNGWEPIIKGLVDSLQLLRDDCGVIVPRWLPYNTLLIPLAATFAFVAGTKGPDVAAVSAKLKTWFWCSVFGQVYENAPNSQAAKDFTELKRWIAGGDAPQSVQEFSFDMESLGETTPRQRALYRGVMALILRNEARDFHTGKRITANMISEQKIDDHHVFPQKYIGDNLPRVTKTQRDCVLNRTLIDKKTNIRISKRAPSDYLNEIQEAIGDEKLELLMRTHLLPANSNSPLMSDDFDSFLQKRLELISTQIIEATT